MVIIMGRSIVAGIGINDADYDVQPKVNGQQTMCPFYMKWTSMLRRCYSKKFHLKHATYSECSIAPEWIYFSCFKDWMVTQDYHGKQLDKDLIFLGNKIYSPDTCLFIDKLTNDFIVDQERRRGKYPTGVSAHRNPNKLMATCRNPFTKKTEHLGVFYCQETAHLAWKKRKHELACQLADMQTDERVAQALRSRYL